jgi:hypothetical protein
MNQLSESCEEKLRKKGPSDGAGGRIMLIVSLVVFAVELAVYIASIFPGCHMSALRAFVAMLFSLIPFILMFTVEGNPLIRSRSERKGPEAIQFATGRQRAMWNTLPVWFRGVVLIVAVCTALGTLSAIGALYHGGPELRNGQFLAGSSKRRIPFRRISEDEYWRLQGHQARFIGTYGIAFSGLPLIAFVWDRRRRSQQSSPRVH